MNRIASGTSALLGAGLLHALLSTYSGCSVATELAIGVLEERYESTVQGEDWRTGLRLGFSRTAAGWRPVCESKASPPWEDACQGTPEGQSWTVVSKGSAIGVVHSGTWVSNDWYKDAGLLRVTDPAVPRVGDRTEEFVGWTGGEVHRPLVAIAGKANSYFAWTLQRGVARDRERVFPNFRKLVPFIEFCKARPNGETTQRRKPVTRNHVEVVGTLQSGDGARLVGMRIKPALYVDCDGIPESGSAVWFVESKGRVRPLLPGLQAKNWAASLVPIEVGDFDGDGSAEALFWFSGYNEDGYVLFFDDFERSARFTWVYH